MSRSESRRLNAMLNVRVKRDQLDELERTADELGVPMGELVRRALNLGLVDAAKSIERDTDAVAQYTDN